MKIIPIVVALALTFASTAQAQMSQADAFASGKTAGNAATNQATFNAINPTSGNDKIDGYSNTAAESSYWGVGVPMAPIVSGGTSKIAACSGPPSSDPRIKQQCEAILALQHQPSIRPPGLITASDPLIQMGKAITDDPESIAGSINGAYSACNTVQVNHESPFVIQTCDEISNNVNENCTIGREIVVDPDYLYGCTKTISTINHGSCSYGEVIQVQANHLYQCKKNEYTVRTNTCTKTANVVLSPSWAMNCTAGQLMPGSTAEYQIYCTGVDTTMRIYVVRHPWAGNFDLTVPIAPGGGYTGHWNGLFAGSRTWIVDVTCSAAVCSITYTQYGSRIPDGSWTIPGIVKPAKVPVYVASATWENQCAVYDSRL